jgi:hypothetical protein
MTRRYRGYLELAGLDRGQIVAWARAMGRARLLGNVPPPVPGQELEQPSCALGTCSVGRRAPGSS